MNALRYNCNVMLKVSNGTGVTCRIITHIRNNYHTYDLYDFVEFIDIQGLTPSQTRKVRETFKLVDPLGTLSNLIDIRFQIIRIY